jgi:hypothetical protein
MISYGIDYTELYIKTNKGEDINHEKDHPLNWWSFS